MLGRREGIAVDLYLDIVNLGITVVLMLAAIIMVAVFAGLMIRVRDEGMQSLNDIFRVLNEATYNSSVIIGVYHGGP